MITTLRQSGFFGLLIAMLASPAAAQLRPSEDASVLYGRGVHDYFAGRSSEAEAALSRAITLNPNDPRMFYFRALSRLQAGRADEARADMQSGASLEAGLPDRFAVGTALQRVQGSDRLLLEKFRQQARAAALTGQRLSRAQVEQSADRESAALRQQVVVPLDEFLGAGNPRALTADELARRAAVAKSRATAPPLPPQRATTQPTSTEADPFAEEDAPSRDTAAAPAQPAPAAASPPDSAEPDASEAPAETDAPAETEAPAGSEEDPFSDLQP